MPTERLSVLDASFLTLESTTTPLQTGGLGIFEPGLSFADVYDTLANRLDRVPLARKKVQELPFGGRPAWVDDAHFDLSYHLRHAALPSPGAPGQLGELLSRLMSRPLDRERPLWELYVIEGLEGGRTGVFRKVHLATAGQDMDIFSVLLDEEPDPRVEDFPPRRWEPQAPVSQAALTVDALRDRAGQVLGAGRELADLAAAPGRILGSAASFAGSALGVAARVIRSAPPSPLNVRLSPHRRFVTVRIELEDLRSVRRAFGGTINDVVVAVAGDAVGRLLRWRGHETKDLDLRVMVPVRVEEDASGSSVTEARTIGDGVVGVLAPLPVMEMDPVARLYRVMGELAGLRESRQAVAANDLVKLAGYAPPNLHAIAARFASAEQRYNLALSNAPGPQTPRFLRGVRMEESYPFIPLAGDAALSMAVSSYAGGMCFGILGDYEAMPDLEALGGFVREAVTELADAAAAAAG
jgi:diacylglycerol O-acyltransferase / wax synthase